MKPNSFIKTQFRIHSKRCWIDQKLQEATILFNTEGIEEIILGPLSAAISDVVDYGDAVIMPGAIDAHVHINEPGRSDWEGFATATKAAAAGGVTTIVDMPLNSTPVSTTAEAFQEKLDASKGQLQVNCGFYGGLIPGNISELEGLIEKGVLGIKAFLSHSGIPDFPNVKRADLEAAMPILARRQIPLLVHCEISDPDLSVDTYAIAAGNYLAYLASRPKSWENNAVQLMIELCAAYQCHTHIVHVASDGALAPIANAKKEGLPLTAETCPHYLFFDAEHIPNGNTLYKCAPPIRRSGNQQNLRTALKTGVLDFISTDHSPAPPQLKAIDSGDLKSAWGGISSLQYFLSAAWSSLKDQLSLEAFIPLLTSKPAQFLAIDTYKGALKKDMDADLTIWSPEESFLVKKENNFHRHPISPYIGQQLSGAVKATYVNGIKVFENNHIITQNAGKWILKKQ